MMNPLSELKAKRVVGVLALFALVAFTPLEGIAQDEVEITSTRLDDGVYMMMGQGGNMGLFFGPDGAFLIDDQFAPLTPAIIAAIGELTSESIRFVINTHFHFDHTGGNEKLGAAGALIVGHENVRARMSIPWIRERAGHDPSITPPSPDGALPVLTFSEELSFHLNGQELRAVYVPNAHTDSDAIIHFVGSNVLHMGDTFFNGRYPFIDTGSGGGIDGYIAAQGRGLALADENTQIIPGHGPLGTREDLQRTRDALKTIRDRVFEMKRSGLALEAIQAQQPPADLDATVFGGQSGAATVAAIFATLPPAR